MKIPTYALLLVTLFVVLTFPRTVRADDLPSNPTLILSAGLLMLSTPDVRQAQTLSAIASPENLVVVPAGQYLLAFPDQILDSDMLALSEAGFWGYIPKNSTAQKWYVPEGPLRDVYDRVHTTDDNGDADVSVLVIASFPKIFGSGIPAEFTRGETYVARKNDDSYSVFLPPQKRKDIETAAAKQHKTFTAPATVDLPAKNLVPIDLGRVLPKGVTLSKAPKNAAGDMQAIFRSWHLIEFAGEVSKACDNSIEEARTIDTDVSARASAQAGANFSLLSYIKAQFNLGAEANAKVAKTIAETKKEDGSTDKRLWTYLLQLPGTKQLINVEESQSCNQDDSVYSLDADEFVRFSVASLIKSYPPLLKFFPDQSGHAVINCYTDYLTVRNLVLNRSRGGADVFLTRFARITDDNQDFFSCKSGA